MHVRRRVPLLKIVPVHTMLSKLPVAKLQLILAHVVHFMKTTRIEQLNYGSLDPGAKVALRTVRA